VAASWAGAVDVRRGSLRPGGSRLAHRAAQAWCIALALLAVVRLPAWGLPDPSSFPGAPLVRAIPAGCRVLAEYDDGGPILLARWADGVRVAADGRNDVFGEALLLHLETLVSGRPGALEELAADRVGCLVLLPTRPIVGQALAAGWRLAARDDQRVLVLAPSGPSSQVY
jgi:hypothetical protein